jgi:tryptophan-rich sensory protein
MNLQSIVPSADTTKSVLRLGGFVALAAGAAFIGSRYSPASGRGRWFYQFLKKPPFTPPKSVFPIVWPILYALIALSGWKTYEEKESPERTRSLALWAGQLGLNALWSKLFFGDRNPRVALADIGLLLSTIGGFIGQVRKVNQTAAWMMVPYLAWVAFAAVLNEEIVRRN